MNTVSYSNWVQVQSEKLRSAINRLACSGIYDGAVYVMPSCGAVPGELILSTEPVIGTVNVLRFPGVGDRVAAVPSSHLYSALWDACRREPICPV